MDIWRRTASGNSKVKRAGNNVFQSPPPYPFNDVIINSVIPEYGKKVDVI